MEGFKGAPGPWHYESETGCVVSDSEKNSYGGGFMLGCYERHWDGKLVSAAPELLEACLRIQAQFRQAGITSVSGSLNPAEDSAAQIDAAIAKARGQ